MDKKRVLSIAASAVLVGSIFTGCSWNSDDEATSAASTSTTINAPQDGLIVKIPSGGLDIIYTDRTCSSNTDLTVASGKYTLNVSDFTCNTGTASFSEAYKLKVKPGATVDTDGDGAYNAVADTKPLDIEIKAKSTDTFPSVLTTLREVATEQGNTALATSLANVGAESPVALLATKPQLYAVSQMVVKAIKAAAAAGKTAAEAASEIGDATTGITTISLSSVTAPTITTGTSASANVVAFANTDSVTALTAIVKAKVGTTTASAATMAALTTNIEASNKTLTNLITDLGVTGNSAVTAASSAVTAADTAISTAKTTMDAYDNAAKLTVNTMALKIGSYNYVGSSNNFAITRSNENTISSSDDVVISIGAIGANSFGVTNGTLKAKVVKGANTLTLTITNVTIASNATTGKVSATIGAGATVSVDATGTTNTIDDVTGTLNSAITTNDLSFSLNTLIGAITTNSDGVAAAKTDILGALTKAGEYTLTVGLNGTMTTNAITNLTDVSSALGSGYKGFTGTVTVVASAAELAAIQAAAAAKAAGEALVVTNLATANTQATAATAAIASIETAATSTAVDAAVTAAATAKTALDTACNAVIASTYATSTQVTTATNIKSAAATAASGVASAATDRKAYLIAHAPYVQKSYTANYVTAAVANSGDNAVSGTYGSYTATAYVNTTAAVEGGGSDVFQIIGTVKNGSTTLGAIDFGLSGNYASGTKATVKVKSGSTVVCESAELTIGTNTANAGILDIASCN